MAWHGRALTPARLGSARLGSAQLWHLFFFPRFFGGSSTMTRRLSGHSNIRVRRKMNVGDTSFRKRRPHFLATNDAGLLVLVRAVAPARALLLLAFTHRHFFLVWISIDIYLSLIFSSSLIPTCWIAAASPTTTAMCAPGNWPRRWHLRPCLRTFPWILGIPILPPMITTILPSRRVLDPYLCPCPRWLHTVLLP